MWVSGRYVAMNTRIFFTSTMVQLGAELEEAARVNSGSWLRTFGRIWLPLLRPAVVSAWILLFVIAVRVLHDQLLGLWEQSGATVVFVTHDIGEATTLADRVLVMSRRAIGVVEEIRIDLARPRSAEGLQAAATYHDLYRRTWTALKERAMTDTASSEARLGSAVSSEVSGHSGRVATARVIFFLAAFLALWQGAVEAGFAAGRGSFDHDLSAPG